MTAPSPWPWANQPGIAWARLMTALHVASWPVRWFRRSGGGFWPKAGIVLSPELGCLDRSRSISIRRLGARVEGYRSRSGFLTAVATGPALRAPTGRRQD